MVLLVHTSRSVMAMERLAALLPAVRKLEIDAYNVNDIVDTLQDVVADLIAQGYTCRMNLTGGTKAMSLGAFIVAQSLLLDAFYMESERFHSRIYEYTWENGKFQGVRNFLAEDTPDAILTIEEWLDLHYSKQKWHPIGANLKDDGGKFESAIGSALAAPRVDEIILGIRALEKQIDLDVVVRVKNQFGILEAKGGENGRRLDGVKQLNNARQSLGTYTRLFRVITVEPDTRHQELLTATRIQDIILPTYITGTMLLPEAEALHLQTELRKAFGLP